MVDAVTVLVVEDDPLIQLSVEDALSGGGFNFDVTPSGEKAITLIQAERFRAVLTDINLLGELDGWEVAKRAREIEPTIPVIYMTGTHAEDWASKGVPNSVMLTKPFAPAQLVTALSSLLNARVPPNQSNDG